MVGIIYSYQYTPYIWPLLTAIVLAGALGFYCWRHRSVPGATGLAIMAFLAALKTMASALELSAGDFSTKLFWFQIQGLCVLPFAVASVAFALGYAGLETWHNRRTYTLIAIPALLVIPFFFTNDAHHLLWTHLWPGEKIRYTPGVLTYALMGYGLLLSVLTISVFIGLFIRSPLHRWPVGLILFNMFTTRTLYFLNAAGLNPVKPFDPNDLAINYVSLIYFVAFFQYRLFDVVPVARNRAIEQMRDGILVLDAKTRIVDLNGAAQKMLGLTRSKVTGCQAAQVLVAYPDLLKLVLTPAPTQVEVWLSDVRCYGVHISPLIDRRGFGLGKLILFYDVSEERRAQKQLQDHQQTLATLEERERLARELHDGVGQVLAAAHLQVHTAGELLARGQVAGAEICLNQLAEVIREGKVSVRDYLSAVKAWSPNEPFFAGLRRYFMSYSQNARVRTELVIPPEIEKECLGETVETQLQRIIQEALTNIRKHAGARSAKVIFALDDGQVKVTIEDDGRGFDPAEIKDREGFGLRAMRGRAEAMRALFHVNSSPGKGTQVIIHVPWRKEET